MQKVLTMTTKHPFMRMESLGQTHEDGDQVTFAASEHRVDRNEVEVGLVNTMNYKVPFYKTVLHAIGDGWKLMAPPIEESKEEYTWWLTRD